MKNEIPPAAMIAVVAVALILVGVIGFKILGPHHSPGIENVDMRNKYMPNYPFTKNELKTAAPSGAHQ